MSRSFGEVVLRPLDGIEECRAAVAFQESIWGEGFSERVPASLLHVLPRVGSVAIAAWTTERPPRMIGFVFGVTGVEGGEIVHWSDILGVAAEARDLGLGRRLKLAQREAARAAGAVRMHWTFDPLEARNAWFNLERLGARSAEYRVDMYGAPDSPLHRGIGTDRLVVRWELAGGTAHSEADGRELDSGPAPLRPDRDPGPFAIGLEAEGTGGVARPSGHGDIDPSRPHRVAIPADVQRLKARDPELAMAWRLAVREALTAAFASGLWIVGAERIDGGVAYRLDSPRSSPELPA